jgi:hypothetical protein
MFNIYTNRFLTFKFELIWNISKQFSVVCLSTTKYVAWTNICIPTWAAELRREFISFPPISSGARGNVVVKALCYKLEDRGFKTRWDEFLQFA